MKLRSILWISLALAVVLATVATLTNLWRMIQQPPARPSVADLAPEQIFARYDLQPTRYSPQVPEYRLSLGEVGNLKDFEKARGKFTSAQKKALTENNFFIAPNLAKFYADNPDEVDRRYDDWTFLYGRIGGEEAPAARRPENAVFVTSDFLLHVFHRLLEKEFDYLEQRNFYHRLKKISETMLDRSITAYNGASQKEQKESFRRLIAYFAVPAAILGSAQEFYQQELLQDNRADSPQAIKANLEKLKDQLPPGAYDTADRELALVLAADQIVSSPLLGKYQEELGLSLPEDYTQYAPRGHYNRNPVSRTYFRAMMWYGRMNFLLASPELTRDAVNITLLFARAGLRPKWEDIYIPTTFFVGESDDLGIYEYGLAIQKLRKNAAAAEPDAAMIKGLQSALQDYRNPRIMSSAAYGDKVFNLSQEELRNKTKGFHFMGQRFTADAFVFTTLTQGDEKPDPQTGEKLPGQPTALMVMSLLGSQTADPWLAQWIDQNASDSKAVLQTRMAGLKKYFHNLTQTDWTQNIYWGWLYTLRSLLEDPPNQSGYPMFMKTPDWSLKNLQCSLGSWTELKHDTLLYAKQTYAEMGNGEEEKAVPPVPRGYVEPHLAFLDRLIALQKMTEDGLRQRKLLDNEFLQRNQSFLESLEFFRKIALAEIQNEEISPEDFERLRLEPGKLQWVLSPLPGEEGTENYARAALIADVHTDFAHGKILYEAVGIPNYLFVALKDRNGARLTQGLVYSYYEFNGPLSARLTDEQWRQWNYRADKSKIPAMPAWSKSLMK
jgi:hypothetical protein